jgi:predicted enzyme related to lactoylglutathione lyase
VATPALGSILLASADPDPLRRWYEEAFDTSADSGGVLRFGELVLLIDGRDDVEARPVEGQRVILNFHVADARAAADRLDRMGVTWVAGLERRPEAWFGTLLDPDGNYLQIIEFVDGPAGGNR